MLKADEVLARACAELGWNLAELVARCSYWAHPTVFERLQAVDPYGRWFPDIRRMRSTLGEKRRQVVDGQTLDDNTYANYAIKLAAFGRRNAVVGFHACHVWESTCYDPRYHTCIANLVLIPAPLAGLSDHDAHVVRALRYRAQQLYGWRPDGEAELMRPSGFPSDAAWRQPASPDLQVRLALELRLAGVAL